MLLALALVLLAIPPPVVQYLFQNGQASSTPPQSTPDSASPSILGPLTTSATSLRWAAERQGTEIFSLGGGFRAVSAATSASVLPFIDTEFSLKITFYATMAPPAGQSVLVAGFGSFSPGAALPACSPASAAEGGLRVVYQSGSAAFQVVLQNPVGDLQCETTAGSVNVGEDVAFVYRVQPNSVRITTSDGSGPTTLNGFSLRATRWNPHPLVLASPHVTTGFLGFIRELSIYNKSISDDEASALVSASPPNSAPYTTLASPFPVVEDVRTLIPVTCADFDGDAFTIALTDLPTRGSMYLQSSNVAITRGELPLIVTVSNLFYKTAPNDVFTAQFRYKCVDSKGAVGRERAINIPVTPVNDPPVPANTSADAFEQLVSFRLSGTDVERTPFRGAKIVSLPLIPGATLRRVNPNGTPGAPIALGEVVPLDVFYEPPPD
jgi:hypothetical protein